MSGGMNDGVKKPRLELRAEYKWDIQLSVSPAVGSWGTVDRKKKVISNFPSPKEFFQISFLAYKDNATSNETSGFTRVAAGVKTVLLDTYKLFMKNITCSSPEDDMVKAAASLGDSDLSKLGIVPDGFEFLAEARNASLNNGYYGAAYINKEKRQIIISHRGTERRELKAWITNISSICLKKYTPRVSSAMTFSDEVVKYAQKNECEVFFTGHSLGAWLAQITCFSSKFLTLEMTEGTRNFVSKRSKDWNDLHPYTAVFDSPGALEFLRKMQDDLFPRNDPESQMNVNVTCLPVDVFQFLPNTVNAHNTQIGSVYLVNMDMDKAEIKNCYAPLADLEDISIPQPIIIKFHFMDHGGQQFLADTEEDQFQFRGSKVIDWRIETWDDFLDKWAEVGRSVAVELDIFPQYFLTKTEKHILKNEKNKEIDGSYEGLFFEDEVIANRITQLIRENGVFQKGVVQFGMDKRKAIPLARQFVKTLQNQTIWWNPKKPQLPENYIPRTVGRSCLMRHEESVLSRVRKEYLNDLVKVEVPFILLVDDPGMGKSSEMTHLEIKLRTDELWNRVVVRVNLNDVQKALLTISKTESASSVLTKIAPFLPTSVLHMSDLSMFLLLDGLDEVCPKHQSTMINILRIFTLNHEKSGIRIIVSTRPHLREALETEFGLQSWSLFPLTPEEKEHYMIAIGISREQVLNIRYTLTQCVEDLLSNPLMLFMFVDVFKSRGIVSAADLDIYDLYSHFVDVKHENFLVEKQRMEPGANHTDLARHNMLSTILPFYYHVALEQLLLGSKLLSESFLDSLKKVTMEPPKQTNALNPRTYLLSCGLLIEGSEKNLLFKHRSFAEFFFAGLLASEDDNIPQIVRDTLFGSLYGQTRVGDNVEIFVKGALSKRLAEKENEDKLLLSLTARWISVEDFFNDRCRLFYSGICGRLFCLLGREILLTLINGSSEELWEIFRALLDSWNSVICNKVMQFMTQNGEWCRKQLFKTEEINPKSYSPSVARLMSLLALECEEEMFLNEDEVCGAFKSCDKLVYIVTSIRFGNRKWRWDFVEKYLGKNNVAELMTNMDDSDFLAIINDKETVWKLFNTLSQQEIYSLVTNAETRVTDLLGKKPQEVSVLLGNEFVSGLAEFRGKFGDAEGRTIFELGGCDFALDFLWGDLLREIEEGNYSGAVSVALRETLRKQTLGKPVVLGKLECQFRMRRKCPAQTTSDEGSVDSNAVEKRIVEWLLNDYSSWNKLLCRFATWTLLFLGPKQFEDPSQPTICPWEGGNVKGNWTQNGVLRSLILSLLSCQDDEDNRICCTQVALFLDQYEDWITGSWNSILRVILDVKHEDLIKAASPLPSLLSDVSVGGVFLKVITDTQSKNMTDQEWVQALVDVIKLTPCCDLYTNLQQLRRVVADDKQLQKILTDCSVNHNWSQRFGSQKNKEHFDTCGLTHFIRFYFLVMGNSFEWMKPVGIYKWGLISEIPVEIATVLERNPEWTHMIPQFVSVLKELPKSLSIICVAEEFRCKTEWQWERLIRMFGGEESLLPSTRSQERISIAVAAPLTEALTNMMGMEKAKIKPSCFWQDFSFYDCLETLAPFFHMLINFEDEDFLEKLAWPGVLSWEDQEGNKALDVAKAKFPNEQHKIRLLLKKLSSNRQINK